MENENEFVAQVRGYYDRSTELYVRHLGTTIQAGVIASPHPYGPAEFREHNLFLAARAGIRPGARVLDAGCGVCGPSIDIANAIQGVTIDAMTLSDVQAEIARENVCKASLEGRVRVAVGDYHRIPFDDDTFEVVFFFESLGYAYDPAGLFREVRRALRPGGTLYVKDVFVREGELTEDERKELRQFDRVYVQRTTTMSAARAAISAAGFRDVRATEFAAEINAEPFHRAMVDWAGPTPKLNAFGEMHFRPFKCLPIVFGELRATK